jgi:hypothetical protein
MKGKKAAAMESNRQAFMAGYNLTPGGAVC